MDLPDLSLTWIISLSATVLLLTYFWFSRRNPKYPPCPLRPWPIVGNLLQLSMDPREQFIKFREQCGDIFSLYLGSTHIVVLSGLSVVKEAIIKQGDDFSDKAVLFVDIVTDGVNKGIACSSGAVWKENRSASSTILKNFDFGKNTMAARIQEEINHFLSLLDSLDGERKDVQPYVVISVSNVMCSIIVGNRYDYDDKEFLRIQDLIAASLSRIHGTAILNFFPWLRFLPGDLFGCKVVEKNLQEFYNIFADFHIHRNEDIEDEPGNFIAGYLQEMKRKQMTHGRTCLDKANLLVVIKDLFIAGTETAVSTIRWFFLYMINYPDVQEKIYSEIKEVVGGTRTPNMQDRAKLVYTTATIMEVQRLASLIPFSLPRLVSRDVNLHGYVVPKGAQVLVNFDSILHDPHAWGVDADEFRPDRFIDTDGSLFTPEAWIPFSLGRRICMGETMGKMVLFLFVSNILQRFQIVPADSEAIPAIKGHLGITHTPLPSEIRFISRA